MTAAIIQFAVNCYNLQQRALKKIPDVGLIYRLVGKKKASR